MKYNENFTITMSTVVRGEDKKMYDEAIKSLVDYMDMKGVKLFEYRTSKKMTVEAMERKAYICFKTPGKNSEFFFKFLREKLRSITKIKFQGGFEKKGILKPGKIWFCSLESLTPKENEEFFAAIRSAAKVILG